MVMVLCIKIQVCDEPIVVDVFLPPHPLHLASTHDLSPPSSSFSSVDTALVNDRLSMPMMVGDGSMHQNSGVCDEPIVVDVFLPPHPLHLASTHDLSPP